MKIRFLGAAQTVTGSKTLVSVHGRQLLVDCGLFQGFKSLRLKNWEPLPFAVADLGAVLLTHAHLDHSGSLPLLIKSGYRGPIYCTPATLDLCRILLPDAGYLQEEEARFANKHGFSKHHPALALFTQADAESAVKRLVPIEFHSKTRLFDGAASAEFIPAGHLLGAASIRLQSDDGSILFSGDVGRDDDLLMRMPETPRAAETVIIESTYGDRLHAKASAKEALGAIIRRTLDRGGTVLIPSFAVGRAQLILYLLHQLKKEGSIPDVPIFLNSPMASLANEVFCKYAGEHRLDSEKAKEVCAIARVVKTVEESIEVNEMKEPKILIAASGMSTGGRVLHHLKAFAPDPKSSIVFAGFQAGGTRGESIVHGAREVKIHGEYWPIRAEVANLDVLSGHADRDGLLRWLENLAKRPKRVFVTHGESSAADFLRRKIVERLGIEVVAPEAMQEFDI